MAKTSNDEATIRSQVKMQVASLLRARATAYRSVGLVTFVGMDGMSEMAGSSPVDQAVAAVLDEIAHSLSSEASMALKHASEVSELKRLIAELEKRVL